MTTKSTKEEGSPLSVEAVRLTAYAVAFAVMFNLTTSIFALFAGLDPLTRSIINGPIVAGLLIVSKLTLLRRFSTTLVIGIASFIAIFTTTFGPPNPYKVAFLLAGLAFDLGTFFRTRSIRPWNLGLGLLLYGITVGVLYVWTIGLIAPQLKAAVAALITPAVSILIVSGWILAFPLFRLMPPGTTAPRWVLRIRRSVGSPATPDTLAP